MLVGGVQCECPESWLREGMQLTWAISHRVLCGPSGLFSRAVEALRDLPACRIGISVSAVGFSLCPQITLLPFFLYLKGSC